MLLTVTSGVYMYKLCAIIFMLFVLLYDGGGAAVIMYVGGK